MFRAPATTANVSLMVLLCALVSTAFQPAEACELCDGPGSDFVALQDHIERWPLVALGDPVGRTREGRMQFRITRILKGNQNLQVGAKVAPPGVTAALPGHVWLLLGRKAGFQGGAVLMLRPGTLAFLREAPRLPGREDAAGRLRALVPWLQHDDPMVRASARKEFADAPYAAVKVASKQVRPDDLVTTLADPTRAPGSRGAQFLLLGLTGGAAERKLMATWMQDPAVQRAAGYSALLAAWLTQTGSRGIPALFALLDREGVSQPVVGGAIVRALGFHARNETVLPKRIIVEALRRLLPSVAMFGVTLEELQRLDAWDELDLILEAYALHKQDAPWTVGPVLRYLEAHPAPRAKKVRERLMAELSKPAPKPPASGG